MSLPNHPFFFSLLWKHSISREQTLVRERGAGSLRAIPGFDIPGSLLSESPLAFKRSFNLPPNARKPIDALGFRFRSNITIFKTILAGDSGGALALHWRLDERRNHKVDLGWDLGCLPSN